MEKLIKLRQHIHQNPELSSLEFDTSKHIEQFVLAYKPSYALKLGKTGLAFVFDSENPGSTTLIRAELDALPIQEQNTMDYVSSNHGVAHLCGHDGHMTMVAGLADYLSANWPQKGKVVLLFQPAEETGEGAFELLQDKKFDKIAPDYVFALHNIPGVEMHKILYKAHTFAVASKGATLKLIGKTAHAAEPEKGISPTNAVAAIIDEVNRIKNELGHFFTNHILITIVHINLGEIAFGTSPGYAEMCITLRAFNDTDLETLTQMMEDIIAKIAVNEKLKHEISYSEIFPATMNHPDCVNIIKRAAEKNELPIQELSKPFNWSEDFGYYTQKFKGGFFGLGSGLQQPALHNPNYNFPDTLLKTGIQMFTEIINQINY